MLSATRPINTKPTVATLFERICWVERLFEAGRFAKAYEHLPAWLEARIVKQCPLPCLERDGVWTQSVTYAFGHTVTFVALTPAEVHAKMCRETVDHALRAMSGFQQADIDFELLLPTN